ncbi:MAG TPA: DUF1145 domain-containing protein [Pseudomonadales bacterium]|nr:DUF1145 domain-containing protein [Pseudomonadales bacterium]
MITKVIVLCLWVACGVSLFFPAESGGQLALRYGALLVLGIHAVEALLFRKEIRRHSANPLLGYALILLFGAVQMAEWRSQGHKQS